MSQIKKNRFINFLKFLVIKLKPPCANTRRRFQSGGEMNKNKVDIDIDIKIESQQANQGAIALPDHLIVEHILPRLPVKSVFRYKSVCKYWHSVISSPKFARRHLECSISRPQILLFEDYDSTDKLHMFLLHYYDEKGLVPLPFVGDGVYPSVDMVGSCNGLVCLFLMELSGSFLVWNPAIHQHRYVIDPYYQDLITGYGFGYTLSMRDYKIVASYSSVLDREIGCFFVYSSKAGEWKRVGSLDGSRYAGELTRFQGVLVGDTLYWTIRNSKAKGIVGFNLIDDELNEVPGMDWLGEYEKVDIFDIKGCLSLWCYCYKTDEGSDVWTLKRHGGVANTWETLFTIDIKGTFVLRFTKCGKYLAHQEGKLKLLDSRKEDVLDGFFQQGIDFRGQITETCDYVDTLTLPFGLPEYGGGGGGVYDDDDD